MDLRALFLNSIEGRCGRDCYYSSKCHTVAEIKCVDTNVYTECLQCRIELPGTFQEKNLTNICHSRFFVIALYDIRRRNNNPLCTYKQYFKKLALDLTTGFVRL